LAIKSKLTTEQENEDQLADLVQTRETILTNPELICFGDIPQSIIDEYSAYTENVINKYPSVMKPLQESIKRSLQKYNRTREPASNAGKEAVYGLNIKIHPILAHLINEKEQMLMEFKEGLKNYKPKASGLEIGILKTKDEKQINIFKEAI